MCETAFKQGDLKGRFPVNKMFDGKTVVNSRRRKAKYQCERKKGTDLISFFVFQIYII